MKNQAQRLLSKNRKNKLRQSSINDDDSSIENDGWICTHKPKDSASLTLVRGDQSRSKQDKNIASLAKKSISFAASDSSSSSDSDVITSRGNKKKTNHSNGKSNKVNDIKSKKSTMPRSAFAKVSSRVSSAGIRASTTPEDAPCSTASSKANKALIPEGITSPSQLQWYRIVLGQSQTGTREKLQPCRKLSSGEVYEYKRKHGGGGIDTSSRGTTMIEYLNLSNDNSKKHYLCVDDNALIPFGYRAKDGISFTFNDDYLQRYLKEQRKISNQSGLLAQKLFLERVCKHAISKEKELRDHADKDLEDYYDDCSVEKGDNRVHFEIDEESNDRSDGSDDDEGDDNDGSDDEELDIPYTQAITFDPDKFDPENEISNEPIRVGDVIQYYSPIHVAGDPRGLRIATVLSIDPKREFPLVLDNAECIPSNINVKRIKVIMNGELVEHPGIFRPISKFKLVKAGTATTADAMKMQTSRFRGIMRNNLKKMKSKAEADGFAPMDLIVNMKGVNDSSQSSSDSAPKPKASRKMQRQPLPSSSSESSDDDSSDDDEDSMMEKSKRLTSNTHKVHAAKEHKTETPKLKENTENASRRDLHLSLGSLSSKASLGTSLASSDDDSSIESQPLNLGKNHNSMTQQLRQDKNDVTEMVKTSGVLDLSLSSDDSVHLTPKKPRTKTAFSTKRTSVKEYPSDSSSDSDSSSSEVIRPKKLKNSSSCKSSSSSTAGSSTNRSGLGKRTPDTKKPPSYSSPGCNTSLSKNSLESPSKRKRSSKTSSRKNSSQTLFHASPKPSSSTKEREKADSEATHELGWTQTSGGWVKSNDEGAGFSLSIGRFK